MSVKTKSKLEYLFNPKSIAIIGASANMNKIGGRPLKFLIKNKYKGRILPVNSKYQDIQGYKCYSNIEEIEEDIDLAIIALPANSVISSLKACERKGVKAAVIFSSGFAELGEEGQKLQEEINKIAMKSGMQITGPNSVGIINVPQGVGATMSQILEENVSQDPIALVSQSGAYGTFIAAMLRNSGLGFNYFVSTGNESTLEYADYLEYFVEKEEVNIVASYIEGIRDGEKLKKAARLAREKKKPIVCIKVGKSDAGGKAASSHTGSITGEDEVYDAFFKEHGIIRAENEEELLDLLLSLNQKKLPQAKKVAIVSMSGGAGIQLSDECEENGLEVAELSDETTKQLKEIVPEFGSAKNPVDLTGQVLTDPNLLTEAVQVIVNDSNVDNIVFFVGLGHAFGDKIANDLIQVANETTKNISVAWIAGPEQPIRKLRKNGVNVFSSVTRCIRTLKKIADYSEIINEDKDKISIQNNKIDEEIESLLHNAIHSKRKILTENEVKLILSKYDIPITKHALATSQQEASDVAEKIGYPVVMKVVSPDIGHKSDAGAIKLNIQSKEEVKKAYQQIHTNALMYDKNAYIQGVLIEEMVPEGKEIIIGTKNDEQFGPVIMYGLGGIFVEVFNDTSLRIAPVSINEAKNMIKETKGFDILNGARGGPIFDIDAIINTITKVSKLSMDLKSYVKEIDINPLIVHEEGLTAVDGLIILK